MENTKSLLTICGEVDKILFHNDNNFAIFSLRVDNTLYKVVGNFEKISVGDKLKVIGKMTNHQNYGIQFSAEYHETLLPDNYRGIIKWLESNTIRGIDEKLSKRIVEKFGSKTLKIIDKEPEKLLEIVGIGKKRLDKIKESWSEHVEARELILHLQDRDVSLLHALKLYKTYKSETLTVLKERPYDVITDIKGFNFKVIDKIALKMGIKENSFERISAGIQYAFSLIEIEGNTCCETLELIKKVINKDILNLENNLEDIVKTLQKLIDTNVLRSLEEDKILALEETFIQEKNIADKIKELSNFEDNNIDIYKEIIENSENTRNIILSEKQKEAVVRAIASRILVITGGPGTGKSTIISFILDIADKFDLKVLLMAPTGRAAKRMEEITNIKAKTIHRSLEYHPELGFRKNYDNPLEADIIIVDESSMLGVDLTSSLLEAVKPSTSTIFLGDVDQLPPINKGNFFKDLINSNLVNVVRLDTVYRQQEGSIIALNATIINSGNIPNVSVDNNDFKFYNLKESKNKLIGVREIIEDISKTYKINIKDIQILCPMKKGEIGVQNINSLMQELVNSKGKLIKDQANSGFKINDKVMQVFNNYKKEVFNGDIGYIEDFDDCEGEIIVNFDGNKVKYLLEELDQLKLAYAITIHKSQGSEYKHVLFVLGEKHFMHQRNLLYTGITRAKKFLGLLCNEESLVNSILNVRTNNRKTQLINLLKE